MSSTFSKNTNFVSGAPKVIFREKLRPEPQIAAYKTPDTTASPLSKEGQEQVIQKGGWRAKLQPASFKGIPFHVLGVGVSIGRRNVVHQYPLRDQPFVEDLGLDTDEFSIEGYVVQNINNDQDYFDERDALISALRSPGSGTLVHPFHGTLTVSLIGKAQINETFQEGGIARFSMNFVRAEERTAPFPKPTIDHVNAVDEAVDDSLDDAVDGFGEKYDAEDVPSSTTDKIKTASSSLNKMLKSAMRSVQGLGPAKLSKALTELSKEYLGIDVNQTCGMANSLIGMFNGLASLSGTYGDIIVSQLFGKCSSAIRGISAGPMSGAKVDRTPTTGFQASTMAEPALIDENLGKTLVTASLAVCRFGEEAGEDNPSQYGGTLERTEVISAFSARESANIEAIINIARLTAITTAAETAIRINYSSYDSAIETLEEVILSLDTQLLKLGNDSINTDYSDYNISVSDPLSYEALQSLRPIFVKSMIGIGASLARIVSYKVPPATIPSLTLAYEKYNDLDREQEIIERNIPLVKNPGFLPQGQEIEILSE